MSNPSGPGKSSGVPKWMYCRDGKTHGPVTSAMLQGMATRGELLRTDFIWKEGLSEWMLASKSTIVFPEISEHSVVDETLHLSDDRRDLSDFEAPEAGVIVVADASDSHCGSPMNRLTAESGQEVGNPALPETATDAGEEACIDGHFDFGGLPTVTTDSIDSPTPNAVNCTNCKVRYQTQDKGGLAFTVCPVCSNRQPYGWTQPANPTPLKAPKEPTPPRDATEEERSAVLAMLAWYAYHIPHVADASFPRDITLSSARTIPFAKASLLVQWEERWLESKTRPHKGEQLPSTCVPQQNIDAWAYEWPLQKGVQKDTYTDARDLPETFSSTTCVGCSGVKNVRCDNCSGAGRHNCPECNATQITRCRACKGTGRVTTYHETQQFGTCSKCGGRGWFPGTARYNRNTGAEVDPTCRACWGRGQRTETVRHAVQVTCPGCSGSGSVHCSQCDKDGKVDCEPCGKTGRVECVTCEGGGRQLHYVELHRRCSSQAIKPSVAWPDTEILDADIRGQVSEAVKQGVDGLDTDKWPSVLSRVGSPTELRNWCESDLSQLPIGRYISDSISGVLQQATGAKRLQRIELKVRQTIAVGLDYLWKGTPYAHWALALIPANIRNHTPLYDRAMALYSESLELWNSGKKDEAVQKARFCLDIAKKDESVEAFLEKCAMPDDLRSGAKAQAWKIFGSATTKRVVAGTTAAVKAVTGWVGGFFSGKKKKDGDTPPV